MSKKRIPNWADIDKDILFSILTRINEPSDHIRITAVCSSWRSTALSNRYNLSHPIPGLIFSHPSNPSYRKFLKLQTPDHPNRLINIPSSHNCRGSYAGWVVLTADDDCSIYLLNPFIDRRRSLPPIPNNNKNVKKAILSSSPALDKPKCVVLILFHEKGAAFCRVGDDSWTALNFSCCDGCGLSDAIFFDKGFRVVDEYGKVYICNLEDRLILEMEYQPSDVSKMKRNKFYLVEIKGQLCRVLRNYVPNTDYSFYFEITPDEEDIRENATMFRVSKMDPSINNWVEVGSLGEYALFLGMNNSFSLSELEVAGINGNKVYFTDDRHKTNVMHLWPRPGKNMGIYDMDSSEIVKLCWSQWEWLTNTDPSGVWVAPLPW